MVIWQLITVDFKMAGFQIDMSPLERSSMSIGQALSNAGGAIAGGINQYKQEQSQGEAEALIKQAMSGDPAALQDLYAKSPQAGQMVAEQLRSQQAGIQANEDRTKKITDADRLKVNQRTIQKLFQIQSLPEGERAAAITELVASPDDDFDETDIPYLNDPKNLQIKAVEYFGAKDAESMFGFSGDKEISAEVAGFNDLIKDFTPEQQKTAKQVKAGLKGRAVSNAELSAIQSGEIESYGKWKAQQKQAEKFAELTGSSRAKAIDSGIERISKIDLGLSNIEAAINAINKGASTGAIESKFPSIKAASVELDNIQGRMALDVIGAVTFGALSEGELKLAKQVALPTGLDGPELIKYLQDKKIAQQKLRNYFNEQIQFLDQGGTVAGFLRRKENSNTHRGSEITSNVDAQAMQWAKDNPSDPRAVQIMQRLQGAK